MISKGRSGFGTHSGYGALPLPLSESLATVLEKASHSAACVVFHRSRWSHGRLGAMGGVDTVRGISYQHAHSVLTALDVVADADSAAVMVEGTEDVMDIAVLDHHGKVTRAKQIKTRSAAYSWGKADLLDVLRRWAKLDLSATAEFEFITDGRLGPTGVEVQTVLEAAAGGDLSPAAELLDVEVSDPACAVMGRCVIRQDGVGVEPVLAEAEREVRTLQPGTPGDAELFAQQAVDRLFVEISVRAGRVNPTERLLTKTEILDIVGGTSAVPRANRWGTLLRSEYLDAVTALDEPNSVMPTLSPLNTSGTDSEAEDTRGDEQVGIDALVSQTRYATVSGQTGSGKSTSTRLLRAYGAAQGIPVVVTYAEAYVAGRLDSLVADGLSALVGRDLPTVTGRQALEDGTAVVVVDGVSEVPTTARDALAAELKPRSASGSGARVVLVGRDMAALGSVLSAEAPITRFSVTAFDGGRRRALAKEVLGSGNVVEPGKYPDARLAQAEHALGDAAGNPMLLTMALRLLGTGIKFTDRAGLYRGVIDQMAARTRTTDMSVVTGVLAVTYAGLLNEGRRYASNYEWQRRIADACHTLNDVGVDADRGMVLKSAERSGLVTRIGHTQVIIPVHDSFADYLAGWAHAERLAQLPGPLLIGDEQRVLFAGEIGGVTDSLAINTATDLPLTTLRLAAYDNRSRSNDTPSRVTELLHLLSPASRRHGVRMWSAENRIIASIVPDQPTNWVQESEGRTLMQQWPTAIVDVPNGPLAVVARLWALYVNAHLNAAEPSPPRPATATPEEAAVAIAAHATAIEDAINAQLERCFSSAAAGVIREALGPLGLKAIVYRDPGFAAHSGFRYRPDGDFAVAYQHATETDTRPATREESDRLNTDHFADIFNGYSGRTGTVSLLRDPPKASAAKRIKDAANRAAGTEWL